jgi:hypothetical protein
MDIASLSMNLSTVEVQSKVSVAMLDKTMEMGETLSQGLVQMIDAAAMERSVHPEIGGNVDVLL